MKESKSTLCEKYSFSDPVIFVITSKMRCDLEKGVRCTVSAVFHAEKKC